MSKMNTQEKEKVTKVVKGMIVDRITEMTEDMSNHDFVENVMDRLEEEGIVLDFENEEVQEEISELIGNQVVPLLLKIMEWGIGKELPKLS
jgi:hypothetical protein